MKTIKMLVCCAFCAIASAAFAQTAEEEGYKLVWSEEFDQEGCPDRTVWEFEEGFVRNEEHQWYQADNARCEDGRLIIEARREKRKNPNYVPGSRNWKQNREYIEYTSSSMTTRRSKSWLYGRFEVRARINVQEGSWPAIWTLGVSKEWPSNGEIDIMEYYPVNSVPCILANAAWGTSRRYTAKWDSSHTPLSHFQEKDVRWVSKFHIWRMDWTEDYIRLYLDDELLNETKLSEVANADGSNPFRQPHYLLLNLAIGGINGGDPSKSDFPLTYEVDYVRVYQKTEK